MSQPLLVSIPHGLGRLEARRRLDSGIGRLRSELNTLLSGLDYHWEGDTLNFVESAMWQRITGRIEVLDAVVRVEIDLRGLCRFSATPSQNRCADAASRCSKSRTARRRNLPSILTRSDARFSRAEDRGVSGSSSDGRTNPLTREDTCITVGGFSAVVVRKR
jgi:Putative polyhydroxyalkanoic acid system protein (PHA_gran_rgn)